MGSGTDDIIDKLFESPLQRFQDERKTSNNRGSEFIPKNVGLLHYIFLKISLKKDKSHIKSPGWLKNKRATINPKNKDDNCFQYAITAALN